MLCGGAGIDCLEGDLRLTEKTQNAMLCCELVDTDRYEEFMELLEDLRKEVTERLGGDCTVMVLDREHPEGILEE